MATIDGENYEFTPQGDFIIIIEGLNSALVSRTQNSYEWVGVCGLLLDCSAGWEDFDFGEWDEFTTCDWINWRIDCIVDYSLHIPGEVGGGLIIVPDAGVGFATPYQPQVDYPNITCELEGIQYAGDMCWVLADYSGSLDQYFGAYVPPRTLCNMSQQTGPTMDRLYKYNRITNCGFEDKCILTSRDTCTCGSQALNEICGLEALEPEPSPRRFRVPASLR